jgi:hypothetical protein
VHTFPTLIALKIPEPFQPLDTLVRRSTVVQTSHFYLSSQAKKRSGLLCSSFLRLGVE